MKKFMLVLSLFLITHLELQAQTTDLQLIEKCLNHYLVGGTNNDFDRLKLAFHPTATMKFVGESYTEVNALDFFRKGMKPGPRQNRKTRIVSISVSGTAANAQLEIEYPTFSFIDYMHLLKVEGEWKIVSKIFYKQEKHAGN